MKAYVQTHYEGGRGFFATVVTEQDYYEGGPFAKSYQGHVFDADALAVEDGKAWCEKHQLEVVDAEDI